ncbi:DUF4369 domain-containing protein [Myroides sp. NP-2]|uniref:DUF4369 domain-containing protein n=1 Tax=Myroides sp. NP-2 TaxID=2759945 RepID=UPI0015FD6610|nr:DUF4369 domain-containing protein [Myroides sp. NP-2]MBB1150704.1 DUF4369 domain-containing protein [Myroides sp. NP-2]
MKKYKMGLFLGIALALTACNSKTNFEITGSLINVPDGTYVYLNQVGNAQDETGVKLDSMVVQGNVFRFEGKIDQPTLGYLSFQNQKGRIPLFIESGKTEVNINQDNFTSFALKGTENNEVLSEFERNLSLYKYNLLSYQGQQQNAYMEALQNKDEEKMNQIVATYKKLQDDQNIFVSNYLEQHKTSLTALYYLYYTSGDDLTQLTEVYESLSETDKQSNLAKLVADKLKK